MLAPALWLDPDVRWLCGVHESEGHVYLIRELYEELLWWLLMPSLLNLAGENAPSRAAVKELSNTVKAALASAEAAGYRSSTRCSARSRPRTPMIRLRRNRNPSLRRSPRASGNHKAARSQHPAAARRL